MIIETFKDILSTNDYGIIVNNNGFEILEKVRNFIIINNLDKILICHITIHINTMIENLFHESNEKLKEDCIELRKLFLHWYDDKYAGVGRDMGDNINGEKFKLVLPIFMQNSSQ